MILAYTAVADPDLQIRMGGGGVGHSNPEIRGAGSNKIFSSVSSKNKGGGGGGVGGPRAPPQNLPLHCRLFWFGA